MRTRWKSTSDRASVRSVLTQQRPRAARLQVDRIESANDTDRLAPSFSSGRFVVVVVVVVLSIVSIIAVNGNDLRFSATSS